MTEHRCAEFTYEKDYGAEIITDGIVRPLTADWQQDIDESETASEWWGYDDALKGWDRISVHGYESNEGITSGHVYKFTEGGVVIGDVLLKW